MRYFIYTMESTLVQLIKSYEVYKVGLKGKTTDDTMTDFIMYLNGRLGEMDINETKIGVEGWNNFNRKTLEEIAGSTLGKLGRYVDHYSRKVFPLTALGSIDEFTYLINLMQFESLTKTELIQNNIHPITSGTEVLKRLLKKEFISQVKDEKDKRSVRVKITEKGSSALYASFEKLGMITKIVSAKLMDSELIQLVHLLKKLDEFHLKIFKDSKHIEMEEIVKKYTNSIDERKLSTKNQAQGVSVGLIK